MHILRERPLQHQHVAVFTELQYRDRLRVRVFFGDHLQLSGLSSDVHSDAGCDAGRLQDTEVAASPVIHRHRQNPHAMILLDYQSRDLAGHEDYVISTIMLSARFGMISGESVTLIQARYWPSG